MKRQNYKERFAQQRLEDALTDTPVVLVHGPRKCWVEIHHLSTCSLMVMWTLIEQIGWGTRLQNWWLRVDTPRPMPEQPLEGGKHGIGITLRLSHNGM